MFPRSGARTLPMDGRARGCDRKIGIFHIRFCNIRDDFFSRWINCCKHPARHRTNMSAIDERFFCEKRAFMAPIYAFLCISVSFYFRFINC